MSAFGEAGLIRWRLDGELGEGGVGGRVVEGAIGSICLSSLQLLCSQKSSFFTYRA